VAALRQCEEDKGYMVFHSKFASARDRHAQFSYNAAELERVESFKYLGVLFSLKGRHKFRECVDFRLEQARRVLGLWRRRCSVWLFDPSTATQLLKTCVIPVLEYGIAMWRPGDYRATEWLKVERFWRLCARVILGVPVRTPVAACLGDLGWRPFWTRAAWQAATLWTRVTEMRDSDLPRQAMFVQRQMCEAGEVCWLTKFRSTLERSSRGKAWWDEWWAHPEFRVQCKVAASDASNRMSRWDTELRREFAAWADAEWEATVRPPRPSPLSLEGGTVEGGSKLRTYAGFKCTVQLEPYLANVSNPAHRRLLSRLRMGVAPLRIETGRFERLGASVPRGIPVEQRLCLVCNCGAVEDEFHFVMECRAYDELRALLFRTCRGDAVLAPVVGRHNVVAQKRCFNLLMASVSMSRALAKFVCDAFMLREKLLTPVEQETDN